MPVSAAAACVASVDPPKPSLAAFVGVAAMAACTVGTERAAPTGAVGAEGGMPPLLF